MTITIVCDMCSATEVYGQYGEPTDDESIHRMSTEAGWRSLPEGELRCPDCVQYDVPDTYITSNGIEVA